jgi:hypothetical protein
MTRVKGKYERIKCKEKIWNKWNFKPVDVGKGINVPWRRSVL